MKSPPLKLQLLWERLVNNDKQAFLDLYKELYHTLINFGIRICSNTALATQAVDDAFIGLWEKRNKLGRVENISAYLHTIVKRKIYHLYNKERRISAELQQAYLESDWSVESYEEFIVSVQASEQLQQRLQEAIKKLTRRQQQLIYLKFFENLSYEQIAARTNQAMKTAYNTIYDALQTLRKELKHQ